MIIQKNLPKSVNLQAFITTYHPSSSVFMTNKTPSGAEKHHWTRKLQNGQNVLFFLSFFFLLSSFFFRRASSILHQPLALVYARNSSILYWAVHDPIAFQLCSLTRRSQPLTQNYGFQFGTPFSLHVLQHHLNTSVQSLRTLKTQFLDFLKLSRNLLF